MICRRCRVALSLLILASAALAGPPRMAAGQERPLKVYISADMEGVAGAVSRQQVASGGSEYETFRRIMTGEVNAAIEAALAAGATEILVSDSHGSGQNLLPLELHPAAQLIRGFPRPLDMMQGIDSTFDAAFLIGYHSSAGRPDGVLAHTSDTNLRSLKLDGVEVSEGGLNAAIAGHFGVPVVLVSGDQVTAEELEALIGDVEAAVVKHAYGSRSARSLHPEKAKALIRERAARALQRLGDFEPWRLDAPVIVDAGFKDGSLAQIAATMPGVGQVDSHTVRLEAADMLEAAAFVISLYTLAAGA